MNRSLTDEMREHVEAKLLLTASASERRKLQAVLLLGNGLTTKEIVARLTCSRATLYRWWRQWEAPGFERLLMAPRVGRPSYLNPEAQLTIETWLASDPATFGYSEKVWTVRLLCIALTKIGITVYDDRVLRRMLKRLGWRYEAGSWQRGNQ